MRFWPKILTRFLMRRFFGGVGIVMLIICGTIFAITFVERLPSNPTAVMAFMDSWVRLLEYIPMFLPLAIFMGTLLTYYTLTRSSENIIVSSAGLSPFQAATPLLFASFFIGIIATTALNPYSVHLSTQKITAGNLNLVDDAIWLRESSADGYLTMRAENMWAESGVLFFERAYVLKQSKDFKFVQRIETDRIKLSDAGLSSDYAKMWDINAKQKNGAWETKTLLNPKTVLDRYLQPKQISFWELPKFIKKMTQIGVPVRTHIVHFLTLLFLPLTLLSMTTLGVAFSQTRQRRNFTFAAKFGIGIAICFILYFLLNLFNTLGATGGLPAILSVVCAPLIIIALAGTFIASFDTI